MQHKWCYVNSFLHIWIDIYRCLYLFVFFPHVWDMQEQIKFWQLWMNLVIITKTARIPSKTKNGIAFLSMMVMAAHKQNICKDISGRRILTKFMLLSHFFIIKTNFLSFLKPPQPQNCTAVYAQHGSNTYNTTLITQDKTALLCPEATWYRTKSFSPVP